MPSTEDTYTTAELPNGTYTLTASKKGYDTITQEVTVNGDTVIELTLQATIKVGANAAIENAISGYENVVLVNDSAIVTVQVNDNNGAPLSGKTVVFSTSNEKLSANAPADAGFEIKGNTVAVTDQNGIASFVVGPKSNNLKSNSKDYVGSIQYRASVVGTGLEAATGSIGFAAITVGNIGVVGGSEIMGENLKEAEYTTNRTKTYSLNNEGTEPDVTYISGQQVSSESATTSGSSISFGVSPQIVLPGMTVESSTVDSFIQPVNYSSGEYKTYENGKGTIITLDVDTSMLKYATLNFNNIQISKYTKMTITPYTDEACTNQAAQATVIEGEVEQSDFAYQIPETANGVKAISVILESAGQVQVGKNAGFDIKNITGVYKGAGDTVNGKTIPLDSASVTWEAVNPTYSEVKTLDTTETATMAALGLEAQAAKGHTFKYQVPVFPFTGNAVIKEYDLNGKLVSYYLAPTIKSNAEGEKNTNVLATTNKAYKATEEEATTILTSGITTDGNLVSVNSYKVGVTSLKGTISIDGVGDDLLDASNRYVYTSVQWNPIPKGEEAKEETDSDAFLALAGQKITVYAQVIDGNGNPVALPNATVNYKSKAGDIEAGTSSVGDIRIIQNTTTDINGRATLILSAASQACLEDLQASLTGAGNYTVKLYIGENTAASADLYWVNANLQYTDSANNGTTYITNNDSVDAGIVSLPEAGTSWIQAVKTVGNTFSVGYLANYGIEIDGLKINMSQGEDNKGTYDFTTGNGVAVAQSNIVNKDTITAKINEDSVGSQITFTAKKPVTTYDSITHEEKITIKEETFTCVGEGTPNLNAKLTLGIDWQAVGAGISIVTPAGTSIDSTATSGATIYVKVMDSTGKNPLSGKKVEFKSGNTLDALEYNSVKAASGAAVEAVTDSKGIAKVTLYKGENITSSIVTATVDGIDQVASTTINWVTVPVEASVDFGVVSAKVSEANNKVVELRFNREVNPSSIKADEFTLTREEKASDGSTKTYTYDVTSATVNGSLVSLTLSSSLDADEYTISVGNCTEDGITYNVTDTYGKQIADKYNKVNFYSTKNSTFDVAYSNGTITISNLKTPVSIPDGGLAATDFVVTINGEIINLADYNFTVANDAKTSYTFSAPENSTDKVVKVYYMGTIESETIK